MSWTLFLQLIVLIPLASVSVGIVVKAVVRETYDQDGD